MSMNPRLLRPTASGFRPSQISGLSAWYDASVASSMTLTGGFVSQWSDLSGGGLHLTQSVEADRPGTGTLNGRTAVSFDGSNDYLANAAVPSGWTFGSVFVAFSQDTTAASQMLINAQVTAANGRMSLLWSNTGEFRSQSVNSAAAQTGRSGGSAATATPRVFVYTFGGVTTAGLRLNAATLSGTTATTGGTDAGLAIGARRISSATSLPFDGLIGEVVIYNRVLSVDEITRVERYLAAKWGVTLYSPPTYADADVNAYITAVELADGGLMLEPGVRDAINDFITGCKSDGIWNAIKASCLLAGPRTLAGINVPLVGPTPTFNAFTASEYDRKTGLVGNGSTMYIDSGRNNNADPQDNKHFGCYITQASSVVNARGPMGCGSGTDTGVSMFSIVASGNRLVDRNNWGGLGALANDTGTPTGLLASSRSGSASYTLRRVGSDETRSVASQTPRNANFGVFGTTAAGGGTTDARLAFYSIGESLDLALLDARISAYVTAIGAAI